VSAAWSVSRCGRNDALTTQLPCSRIYLLSSWFGGGSKTATEKKSVTGMPLAPHKNAWTDGTWSASAALAGMLT
jgi:hypothetical protein